MSERHQPRGDGKRNWTNTSGTAVPLCRARRYLPQGKWNWRWYETYEDWDGPWKATPAPPPGPPWQRAHSETATNPALTPA